MSKPVPKQTLYLFLKYVFAHKRGTDFRLMRGCRALQNSMNGLKLLKDNRRLGSEANLIYNLIPEVYSLLQKCKRMSIYVCIAKNLAFH